MTAAGRYVPHLAMTAMIAIWGLSYAVVKVTLGSLSPFVVIASRFWLAVLCVLPFLRAGAAAQLRATAGKGLLTGVLLATGYLLQACGMRETSASMGGLLAGLIVPLVAVGGSLLFRTRLGAWSLLGLLLGVAGMVLLCWPEDAAAGPRDTLRGILLQGGSMLSFSAHVLAVSHFGRGAPTAAYCQWQLVFVAIAGTIAALLHGEIGAAGATAVEWTPWLLFLLAYLGVLATALGIGVQSLLQHKVRSDHLALLFALQPLFAALFGWLTLGDRMGAMQLAGGAVIVVGVVLTSRDR